MPAKSNPPTPPDSAGVRTCAPTLPTQGGPAEIHGHLPLAEIRPSPTNPRKSFPEDGLRQLAASVREHGILQPVLARPMGAAGRWTGKAWEGVDYFEIVAGERRFRAAKLAGLERIPVVIRFLGDSEVLALQLVENDQREDVKPSEQAAAYARLADAGRSLTQIMALTGKSKSFVRSVLALDDLPVWALAAVDEGVLPRRTAEVVAGVNDGTARERAAAFALCRKAPPKRCEHVEEWVRENRATEAATFREVETHVRGVKVDGTRRKPESLTRGDYEALIRRHQEQARKHLGIITKYRKLLRELGAEKKPTKGKRPTPGQQIADMVHVPGANGKLVTGTEYLAAKKAAKKKPTPTAAAVIQEQADRESNPVVKGRLEKMVSDLQRKPTTPIAKPLAAIAGFPAALAAALEVLHVRTDISLSDLAQKEKGNHEAKIRTILSRAPGTYGEEIEKGVAAVMAHLYPGRKPAPKPTPAKITRVKPTAEEQLQDLGLLPKPAAAAMRVTKPVGDLPLVQVDGFPAAVAHALEKMPEPVKTLGDFGKHFERLGSTVFANLQTAECVYQVIVQLVGMSGYLATAASDAVMRHTQPGWKPAETKP